MKEFFGYTEPFRRFVQNETFSPQANEIPNTAASWLPGDDYYTNFHQNDPYINKMAILADVAPYSREYNQVSSSFRAPKTSRVRDRPQPHPMNLASPSCWRSHLLQWRYSSVVSPSLRTPKPSRACNGRSPS